MKHCVQPQLNESEPVMYSAYSVPANTEFWINGTEYIIGTCSMHFTYCTINTVINKYHILTLQDAC